MCLSLAQGTPKPQWLLGGSHSLLPGSRTTHTGGLCFFPAVLGAEEASSKWRLDELQFLKASRGRQPSLGLAHAQQQLLSFAQGPRGWLLPTESPQQFTTCHCACLHTSAEWSIGHWLQGKCHVRGHSHAGRKVCSVLTTRGSEGQLLGLLVPLGDESSVTVSM